MPISTKTTPLTAEEWSRASIGAVEGDSVALAAARQLLHESAGCTIEEYRGYAAAEELLAAAQLGEVDAAIENLEQYIALSEDEAMYETVAQLYEASGDMEAAQVAYEKYAAGAGAAGGIGFAFLTFLNGRLMRGIELVLSEIALEEVVRDADVVVTGEGRLDNQTVMGKTPVGVAAIAKRHNKPVVAFSGCVTAEAGVCNAHGIDAFFPILRTVCTLEEALDTTKAAANMADTAEQAFRLIKKFAKPEI